MARKRGGREKLANAALRNRLIRLLGRRIPKVHACALIGIDKQTLDRYLKLNPRLQDEIDAEIGKNIDDTLALVERQARLGDASSARWLLEKICPDPFGRGGSRLEITTDAPLAAGVTVYLPRKDEPPAITINDTKQLENGKQ